VNLIQCVVPQFISNRASETQMPEEIKSTLTFTNPTGEEVTEILYELSLYTKESVVPSKGLKH